MLLPGQHFRQRKRNRKKEIKTLICGFAVMIESRQDKTFIVKILPVQFLGTQVKAKKKKRRICAIKSKARQTNLLTQVVKEARTCPKRNIDQHGFLNLKGLL